MNECVHFIGIGGIGMSGLARYFKNMGWSVSGSDAVRGVMTEELLKEGIAVRIGHKKQNIPADAQLIIYNRAILADNPERRAAQGKKNSIVLPYARVVGRLTEDYQTIAITGSHGKSTTTALAGIALVHAGLDPTILVGTKLANLSGANVHMGSGPYLVLEADDYGGAFMEYSPAIAIVTNIDREHMDFYGNFSALKRAFLTFLSNTRSGGAFILNRDDATLFSLRPQIARIAKKNKIKIVWFSTRGTGKTDIAIIKKIKKIIPIAGTHNISNAMAVVALGKILKIPEAKIVQAIGSYKGAWRRMELKGNMILKKSGAYPQKKIVIYDDYAHHPTEIAATLQGFREKFPLAPIVCIFQPHQAKRLHLLFKDFISAFDGADAVCILPLYKVLGRDDKYPHDSAALVRALQKRSPKKPIFYLAHPQKLRIAVEAALRQMPPEKRHPDSPVVVMMGAGDIADLTSKLLK